MSKFVKYPKSANWRIVIPNLQQYRNSTSQELYQLKCLILQRLKHRPQDRRSHMKSQFQRGLRYYHIAVQRHANNVPHLDILLIYDKSIQRQRVDYDFLLKHGNITTYRKLNQAVLDYGKKQDKEALSNVPEDEVLPSGQSFNRLIEMQDLKKDPYLYLQKQMLKDPFHFRLQWYVQCNNLASYISGWSSIKTKLRDMQVAAANQFMANKPCFKFIDRALIEFRLSSQELAVYDSWDGYQVIVDKLNQVPTYGCKRPFKSKQLLLVGRPNTGKTSLILHLQNHCAVYHMDVTNWFPNYCDGVYKLFLWDQFKLKGGMSHTDLLKFLQGSPMDLQYKGGSSLRMDNQLVVMTSNMTLQQHIDLKFKDQLQRSLARDNLRSRIVQLVVPSDLDLFLLRKLLVSD